MLANDQALTDTDYHRKAVDIMPIFTYIQYVNFKTKFIFSVLARFLGKKKIPLAF